MVYKAVQCGIRVYPVLYVTNISSVNAMFIERGGHDIPEW